VRSIFLLSELARRGVELRITAKRILLRPLALASPEILEVLRRQRDCLLHELQKDFEEDAAGMALVLGGRVSLHLYSRSLERGLWLCSSELDAAEVASESPDPILTLAELTHMHDTSPVLVGKILDVKGVFPDARLCS
jgi:hypothetical protein